MSENTVGRPAVVSVKRLAAFLRRLIEDHPDLRDVRVRGEISNWKRHTNGNAYFDLKDESALVHCVAWAQNAARFPQLGDGTAVLASGAVAIYAQRSIYQLQVRAVELEGVGDLHALFAERKRLLAAEGLFDPAHKRPLPRVPFHVALVSSRSANGAGDVVSVLMREYPHIRIHWYETPVQGSAAGPEIARALERAGQAEVDCVLLTRGGGSFEDLFAFSDEAVVRAIAAGPHPVLSAVGHTVDQQLCDFAADAHYETPSAAAHALGPSTARLRARLAELSVRLARCARTTLDAKERELRPILARSRLAESARTLATPRQRLDLATAAAGRRIVAYAARRNAALALLSRRLARHDPRSRLAARGEAMRALSVRLANACRAMDVRAATRCAATEGRLAPAARVLLERAGYRLAFAATRLRAADPDAILQRGYAIITCDGAIVRDPLAVPIGSRIEARVARGTLLGRIEERHQHDDQSRRRV